MKWKNKYNAGNLWQTYPVQLNDKALVPCLVINWSPVCLANNFIVHFEHSKDLIWTMKKTWIIIFYQSKSLTLKVNIPIKCNFQESTRKTRYNAIHLSFAETRFLIITLIPG